MRIAVGLLIMVAGLWLGITIAEHLWMDAADILVGSLRSGVLDSTSLGYATFHLILSLVAGYIVIAIFNGIGNTVMDAE